MSNRGENASLRRLIPVIQSARDQADQPHGHGRGRDTEPYVHTGVSLDINEDRESDEFSDREGEVGCVEVGGELLGLLGAIRVELVSSMGYHVRLNTTTP